MTALTRDNSRHPRKPRNRNGKDIERRVEGVDDLDMMLPYVTDQLGGSTDDTGRFKGINWQVQNWYAGLL